MKVWEIRDAYCLENLRAVEKLEPKAGAGEIVVAMKAASLNYRDLLTVKGVAGQFPLPLEIALSYRDRFAGSGPRSSGSPSQVLKTQYIGLRLQAFF